MDVCVPPPSPFRGEQQHERQRVRHGLHRRRQPPAAVMPSGARAVPGARGLPLLGETLSFLADVKRFIDVRVQQYGATFRTYLFRTSTVLTCSYETGAALLLHGEHEHERRGELDGGAAYAPFLAALYPAPNLVLAADDAPVRAAQLALLQRCVSDVSAFASRASRLMGDAVRRLCERADGAEHGCVSVALYGTFKPVASGAIQQAVLGDMAAPQLERVRRLCAQHFNGVAAVPLSLSAFGSRNARAAAVEAYHQLSQLLSELVHTRVHRLAAQRDGGRMHENKCAVDVVARAVHDGEASVGNGVQVLLTLLSPAVAKAVASTATMAVAVLGEAARGALQQQVAEEVARGQWHTLDCVLMETLRLYPPLAGAMRAATRDTQLHGLAVRRGDAVWLSYLHANRDDAAFERAQRFDHARWRAQSPRPATAAAHDDDNDDDDSDDGDRACCPFARVGERAAAAAPRTPLSFGAGVRSCRGRDVAWAMLRRMVGGLLAPLCVNVARPLPELHAMRYIPVLRPADDALVRVSRRCNRRA